MTQLDEALALLREARNWMALAEPCEMLKAGLQADKNRIDFFLSGAPEEAEPVAYLHKDKGGRFSIPNLEYRRSTEDPSDYFPVYRAPPAALIARCPQCGAKIECCMPESTMTAADPPLPPLDPLPEHLRWLETEVTHWKCGDMKHFIQEYAEAAREPLLKMIEDLRAVFAEQVEIIDRLQRARWENRQRAEAAERALAEKVPEGWVVVPKELTEWQYDALSAHDKMWKEMDSREVYRVLVNAAAPAKKKL